MHQPSLTLGGQTGISPLGTAGRARRSQKQGKPKGCKLSELVERRVVGLVPLHPCSGFVCIVTRQRSLNQPEVDEECSYGKGMGWMQEDRMFKRFGSEPQTRSKRQPLHGVKPAQASPDHFRFLKEIAGLD